MVAWGAKHLDADLSVGTLPDVITAEPESCITMWDYLEHSIDPSGDVADAFRRLCPGGVLALTTGDVGSLLARASLRRWHLMTPRHHMVFFSRATINRMLESAGFEVIWVGTPRSVYPLRYLAHKGSLMFDIRPVHAFARLLESSRVGTSRFPSISGMS